MNLRWGVYSIVGVYWGTAEEMVAESAKGALNAGIVKKGDLTILTSGIKYGEGGTSSIRVHTI